jgi:hypothetical protein
MENNKKDVKSLSYKIGHFLGVALGAVTVGCLIAIIVVFTVKFITWMI